MTNIDVIENKVSFIKKYLKILNSYQTFSLDALERDVTLKGAVERYLYLVCQATIDLAEAVIAYKDFRKPTTFREAFDILGEENLIDRDLVERLASMAGFRNVIAHAYENLDFTQVHSVLHHGLTDIESFLNAVREMFKLR